MDKPMQEFTIFLQHHWLLSVCFFAVIVVLFIVEAIRQKQSATAVTPSRLTQMINRQDAVVIDLRSEIIFKDGHIIDAQSIPLSELTDKTKKLDKFKSKPIVLVCQSGNDSAKVATGLREKGFDVHILSGGMKSWVDAEMPVVKG